MKIAYERACKFLKALVCDFGKINDEIHSILAEKCNFPPFELVPDYTERFQEMSLGSTSYPELGVVYKKAIKGPNYFIPTSAIHRLMKKQLDIILASVQRPKHTTDEVNFEISRRIQWLYEVTKFWWIIIIFLKLNK